jgi:hypothetical protein
MVASSIAWIAVVTVVIIYLVIQGELTMLNIDALTAKVDAIALVVPGMQADYANLKAEIDALRDLVDPTAQAKIDALTAKLDVAFVALKALDDSVPPIPPPGPVA